jgi:hypothetical protein
MVTVTRVQLKILKPMPYYMNSNSTYTHNLNKTGSVGQH